MFLNVEEMFVKHSPVKIQIKHKTNKTFKILNKHLFLCFSIFTR